MLPNDLKPMLASDYEESKIRFPVFAQPKIDGVRGLNLTGSLTGRSLKKHRNKHATEFFSNPIFLGLDGEMAAEQVDHPALCTLTSSALSTIGGEPKLWWWLFDYITPETIALPYWERREALLARHSWLTHNEYTRDLAERLMIVPSVHVGTMSLLFELEAEWLDHGYEGVILRDPNGLYKQGRSTVREGGLLRIKRFIDAEIEITEIIEGQENKNEAQKNELGQQFRSGHQDNLVPNGMVGALLGRLLKDVVDARGNVLIKAGDVTKIGPGCMTHEERIRYFNDQSLLLGKIAKFKLFPKGVKDKPRFPTFLSLRAKEDI